MTILSDDRRESSRQLILDVLAEKVTHGTDPVLFDEDVVMFAAQRLEKHDSHWLREQLGNENFSVRGRLQAITSLSPESMRHYAAQIADEDIRAAGFMCTSDLIG